MYILKIRKVSQREEDGLKVEGILPVTVFFITDDPYRKYEVLKKDIPISNTMEHLNLEEKSKWKINAVIEQCNAVILDENSIEMKVVINFDVLIEDLKEKKSIHNIRSKPFEEEYINNTPGMVVYIPSGKENIWDIGKRYGVSQESVKEINQLNIDEVERGQKILLVKGCN